LRQEFAVYGVITSCRVMFDDKTVKKDKRWMEDKWIW
jgi:hypothetical protein